jgi:hypothetical protein
MNVAELVPAGGIQALASQLGVPHDQAQRGAEALLPSLLAGMGDKAGGLNPNAAGDLEAHLGALGGPHLADNVTGPEPTDIAKGNQLLGGLFGSKDVSRQVAGHAAQNSGLDPALLKKMLPILAMLVAGHMSKRSGAQQGGLGGILGSVLGGMAGGSARGGSGGGLGGLGGALGGAGGPLGGMLGSILGGGRR